MKDPASHIREQFKEGLREYLFYQNEQALNKAYELGRYSLREGFGELDLIAVYHEVLPELQADDDALGSEHNMGRALDFLTDLLAPYEVRQRGYKDLITRLNQKNTLLEKEIAKRRRSERFLQQSKDRFQSLIENALDIITIFDFGGIIRYSSPSVERVLGYRPEDLKGKEVFKFLHPDDLSEVRAIFERLHKEIGEVASAEFRFRNKQGYWIILECVAKSVVDQQEGLGFIVNARDITDRVAFRKELEEKRQQLEAAQHIAHVGSWEWRVSEDRELYCSNEMYRIFNKSPEDLDNSFNSFLLCVDKRDRSRVKKILDKAIQSRSEFNFECTIDCSPDEKKILFTKGQVVTDRMEQILKVIGISQDITGQKESEKRLRRYSEKLRRLSAKVEKAREEERIRIAREIHDELGQMLTVLKMEFSILIEKVIRHGSNDFVQGLKEEKEQIVERVDTILKSVQRITTELRPEVLDNLSLKEALEWQAREFQNRAGIRLEFHSLIPDSETFDKERSTAVFRIFQETLTNIARHSRATQVRIRLMMKEKLLVLEVKDNGQGITSDNLESSGSLGIIGMRERAQLLGGDIQITGDPETGTTVTLNMPVH